MNAARVGLVLLLRSLGAGALVCLISWSLVECAPGTTAERAAVASGALVPGDVHSSVELRAELIAEVASEFDLEATPAARLPRRAADALRFDFGRSWRDGHSVWGRIASRKGLTTLLLCVAALLIALLMSALLAPRSARRPSSRGSTVAIAFSALMLSVPIPWIALLALDTLAYGHPFSFAPKGGMDSFGHGILPIVVLASVPAAVLWRHLHQELLDTADAAWVVAARARGLDETRLWNRHLLKAALPTVFALVPVMLAYLLAASVVVEQVFAIDGLGSMVAAAANQGDVPVLVAFASLSAIVISATSQSMNIASRLVDPRRTGTS